MMEKGCGNFTPQPFQILEQQTRYALFHCSPERHQGKLREFETLLPERYPDDRDAVDHSADKRFDGKGNTGDHYPEYVQNNRPGAVAVFDLFSKGKEA